MANTDTLKSNANYSFLLWWTLANMVALPILLIPQGLGELLLGMFSVMTDGMPIGFIGYLIALIILALSGFFVGTWLGFWQWLVLRKKIPQAGKWILRSSTGVAIGAPLSWLVYGAIFASPIVNRSDGIYFSYWYAYLAFGIFLGLAIGVSQWFFLRQWLYKAEWWIIALPLSFTSGLVLANFHFVSYTVLMLIRSLTESITSQFPNISPDFVLIFIAALNALVALIGVSLITGVLLNWLLRFHARQIEGGKGS